jgi:hypothetical protein
MCMQRNPTREAPAKGAHRLAMCMPAAGVSEVAMTMFSGAAAPGGDC